MKNPKKIMDRLVKTELERLKKEEERKGAKSKVKNPVLQYSNRTKVFNEKLMENVGLVMSEIPELLGNGIAVTRVNTLKDFREVRIFWITSKEGKEEVIGKLLDEKAGEIRHGMNLCAGLGAIPNLVFVQDSNYIYENLMTKLMKEADVGDESEDEERNEKVLDAIKLRSDVLGLDRDKIVRKIEESVERSRGEHRPPDPENFTDFATSYRRALNPSTNVETKERAKKIRKFLAQQRKTEQRIMTDLSNYSEIDDIEEEIEDDSDNDSDDSTTVTNDFSEKL